MGPACVGERLLGHEGRKYEICQPNLNSSHEPIVNTADRVCMTETNCAIIRPPTARSTAGKQVLAQQATSNNLVGLKISR